MEAVKGMEFRIQIDANRAKVRFMTQDGREIYKYSIMHSERGLVIPLDALLMIDAITDHDMLLGGIDYPLSPLLN